MTDKRFRKPSLPRILCIGVGCVFVFSAIAKYATIDRFDLYLFEHRIGSYALVSTFSRLLIVAECLLGIFLIGNIRIRATVRLCALMLLAFTIYLLLQPYLFHLAENDCHCMGDWIHFTRGQSILKNVLLLLMLAPARKEVTVRNRHHRWMEPALLLSLTAAALCINPPDYLYDTIFPSHVKADTACYTQALQTKGCLEDFSEGRKIICFYTPQCAHCRNTAAKMDLMARFHHWPTDRLRCVFPETSKGEADIQAFFEDNHLQTLAYTTFTIDTFLQSIHGQMPCLFFSDNGRIVRRISHGQINEKAMDAFIKDVTHE